MTMPTAFRLRDTDEALTPYLDLVNPAQGSQVLSPLEVPVDAERELREKGAGYTGSVGIGQTIPDDGNLGVTWRVRSTSWAQTTLWVEAMRTLLRSKRRFYVEYELSGVITRHYCDSPVRIAEIPITNSNRILNRRVFDLQFLVQPSPTVVVEED